MLAVGNAEVRRNLLEHADEPRKYFPSKQRRMIVKMLLVCIIFFVGVIFVLIKAGPLAPQIGQANYAGVLASVLTLIATLLWLNLRERIIVSSDYIESRLLFTSRLGRQQIKGWRSRLPNGQGDLRLYGKDHGSNVVLVPSDIERDQFLEDWIKQFEKLE
jgi:hypothetical protein